MSNLKYNYHDECYEVSHINIQRKIKGQRIEHIQSEPLSHTWHLQITLKKNRSGDNFDCLDHVVCHRRFVCIHAKSGIFVDGLPLR